MILLVLSGCGPTAEAPPPPAAKPAEPPAPSADLLYARRQLLDGNASPRVTVALAEGAAAGEIALPSPTAMWLYQRLPPNERALMLDAFDATPHVPREDLFVSLPDGRAGLTLGDWRAFEKSAQADDPKALLGLGRPSKVPAEWEYIYGGDKVPPGLPVVKNAPAPPMSSLCPYHPEMCLVSPLTRKEQILDPFHDAVAVHLGAAGWGCTGVVVSPRLVLTAAHCLAWGVPDKVLVGPSVGAGFDFAVIERGVHAFPGHPPLDVLLLEIAGDLTTVMDLPIRSQVSPEQLLKVGLHSYVAVGYGRTASDAPDGGDKRFALIRDNDWGCPKGRCDSKISMAIGKKGDPDTCNGDSGGPLFVQVDKDLHLVGVTHKSLTGTDVCGEGGVYTRVDKLGAWIAGVTLHAAKSSPP